MGPNSCKENDMANKPYAGYGVFGQGDYDDPRRGANVGENRYGRGGVGDEGVHRGKGPKNYQRSDERIAEMLCERLRDDPDIDASDISVSVQGGRVTLTGTVDSRLTKNAVEDLAEQSGTADVQNELRVRRPGDAS
jgi:osmotically-inducible protein OsmY